MYAVIETGGHQLKVSPGDVIVLEGTERKVGDELTFDRVLALGDRLGTPTLAGAKVTGTVVFAGRGEKIYIQKYRARKQYRRRAGFRASIFRVKITGITG
jgi:large subunit ribosomal protein L21